MELELELELELQLESSSSSSSVSIGDCPSRIAMEPAAVINLVHDHHRLSEREHY